MVHFGEELVPCTLRRVPVGSGFNTLWKWKRDNTEKEINQLQSEALTTRKYMYMMWSPNAMIYLPL